MYKALSDAKVFNLSLDVATQYNLCRFVDRSPSEKTGDKFRTNVLYLETDSCRYEISRHVSQDHDYFFRLAKVKNPFNKDERFFSKIQSLPLPEEHLEEVIADKLQWSDLRWGVDSLKYGEDAKL